MDHRKVSFISCVNNHKEYNTALFHIHNLKIPTGYKIDTIAIENATSITSGYNNAMSQSDAKYKVYIHQDTYIVNRNFISDMITLFQKYPRLGMLGVVGSKGIHTLHEGWPKNTFGSVYHSLEGKGKLDILRFKSVKNDFEKVLSIDGLIMATQYDTKWREDLFKGWHLYDISQSLEFIKAGYDVGVPRQQTPWCFHDCGLLNTDGYQENWNIFFQNYLRDITKGLVRLNKHV